MLSASAIQALTMLVTSLITLVGVITVLLRQIQDRATIVATHENTNNTLSTLSAQKDALQATQATTQELANRPPGLLPPPK
jgi:hypothetical protein